MNNETKIYITADSEGVDKGVAKAKKSIKSLGDTAQTEGKRVSDGLGQGVGGASETAAATETATKSMARSLKSLENAIRRDIAVKIAGGKATREYYEALANQRGLDVSRLNPLLSQLDRYNVKTNRAALTVGQFNNALRQTPAQIADIVTQLAGGQSPFLIMLQQGGQLRDMYGGFGGMFKGLSTIITPSRLAVTGLAGGVAALGYAMYQGIEESQEYRKALILAGDAAGITANRMQDIAVSVGNATGGYADARAAITALVSSGKVGAENYEQFTRAITLQAQATGQSIDDLVKKYVEIAKDPLQAVVALSANYRTMTADVYAQVKALQAQGREQEAVALVQRKFAAESEEMSTRVLENLGAIERGWKSIKETASATWDALKSIGRDETKIDRLAALNSTIQQIEESKRNPVNSLFWSERGERRLQAFYAERAKLQAEINRENAAAEEAKRRQAQIQSSTEASARLAHSAEAGIPKRILLERELAKIEKDKLEALKGANGELAKRQILQDAEYARAAAMERFKEKTPKAKKQADPLRSLSDNQKRLYGLAKSAGEDPAKWLALYEIESASGRRLENKKSGALGHFQIMPQYLHDYGISRAGTKDLATSFNAVRRHHRIGSASLQRALGRELTAGEYYLGHQQGWGGAKALLTNLDKNVVDALSTIMKRGRAVAAVTQNGGQVSMTARQFAEKWVSQANRLQEQFAQKGFGSLDAGGGAYLHDLAETAFDKWQQKFTEGQEKIRVQAALTAAHVGKSFKYQLELMSNPEFANFTETQRQTALEMAKAADAQEDLTAATKKYADISKEMSKDTREKLEDKLFEISLIGKTREEIEKLTLARLWDKQIAQAQKDGAPAASIAQLERGKADSIGSLSQMQSAQKAVDDDWQGGIKSGIQSYIDSFGTMRQSMENATVQTFDKMGDALADFVATGKLDFRNLTVSILQDLSKMLIKMAIVNAMKSALGGYADGGVVGGGTQFDALFSSGGYTGAGGKYEPAGIVHKGEVVFSQQDVRNHGGVAAVERLRLKGYADGGAVGLPPVLAGRLGGSGGGNMQVNITINRSGVAESSAEGDTEMAKKLAEALPGMVEQWYLKNVYRENGTYHK